jgi:CheY-like chemotaxis protein
MMQVLPSNVSESAVTPSRVSGDVSMDTHGGSLHKLLLVDDEVDGVECAALLLRSHGLDVVVVHSAVEALQALQTERDVDVVLSDIMMKGMTGLQLAEAVRATYPSIKIVLMSGYGEPQQLQDDKYAYPFVEKPYKMDTLLSVLRK